MSCGKYTARRLPSYLTKLIFLLFFLIVTNSCGGGGGGTTATTGSAPSAPTGVIATAGSGQVSISWTSVSDATSYNIYWSTTSGVTKTTGTKLTGVTNPYDHTGLTNGTTYYYVVTAVSSYGESSESSQVSAIPNTSNITQQTPTQQNKLDQNKFDNAKLE